MNKREVNYTSRRFAVLTDYRLVFNKKAGDGDYTYANIVVAAGAKVEGVLYELQEDGIRKPDIFEGFPTHRYVC